MESDAGVKLKRVCNKVRLGVRAAKVIRSVTEDEMRQTERKELMEKIAVICSNKKNADNMESDAGVKLKRVCNKVRLGVRAAKVIRSVTEDEMRLTEINTVPEESAGKGTISYTYRKNRTLLKAVPELTQLALGYVCVARAPPVSPTRIAAFSTDFSPEFTIALPKAATTIDHSRFIKPKVRSYSIRYVMGFPRGISKIHISTDERKAGVVLAKRRVIPQKARTDYSHISKEEEMDKGVQVIDLRRQRTIGVLRQQMSLSWCEEIRWMLFNSERMVSCSSEGVVTLWDVAKMRVKKIYEDTRNESLNSLLCLDLSLDGRYIAGGGDLYTDEGNLLGTAVIWSLDDGKLVSSFPHHTHPVTACTFHPLSSSVYTGDFSGQIYHWDLTTAEIFRKIPGHTYSIRSLISHNDILISADERFTRAWSAETYLPLWTKHLGEPATTHSVASDTRDAEDVEETPNEEKYMMRSECEGLTLKQRLVVPFPAGLVGCCIFGSQLFEILDSATGEVFLSVPMPSIITAAAGSRTMCLLGDIHGNLYALDLEMSHMLSSNVGVR
eukprot:TRINITY_DN16391_c0_g1_i1.p1 TRINITY_DN16391_c0_g1~~TRINITY_DN16391_c0_g1_i1.p1  ORF type:complete len:606 (+),score=160.58 TRINITY_DN16391_c0_g1_i1:158-1819(+)